MNNTQLPSLSQILHKGASGGHEFAHIVRMLFEAEEKSGDGFLVRNFDDCVGDIDGADAFVEQTGRNIYVQIKFFLSPFSSGQRSKIKQDYEKAKTRMGEYDEWMLITPDGLQKNDSIWFKDEFGDFGSHKGEPYLTALFFKHPEIGQNVYKNHEFKRLARIHETPQYPEVYFSQFIKPSADIEHLFADAQPTYYDCKRIFNEDWSELMGDVYSEFYRELTGIHREKEKLESKTTVRVVSIELKDIPSPVIPTEKGQKIRAIDIMNRDVTHYAVSFLNNEEGEYKYTGWTFLNGRWVFFGKINRFFRTASKIRSSEDIRSIMIALKCLRAKKIVADKSTIELRLIAGEIIRRLKKK
jgi:hypothetical protein